MAPLDLIVAEDRPRALDAATARTPGAPVVFEARFQHVDGAAVWLSWCAGTIGSATYAVALDITSRREAESLRQAKETAEAASAAKNRLLGNVSHELRTPLSAMLSLLDVLLEQVPHAAAASPPATLADDLRVLRRNGSDLARLIDDLLDLTRAEAGRLDIQLAPCRPVQIVNEVIALLEPAAYEKGLHLAAVFGSSTQETTQVRTDALRLRQILLNLVGNGIKYTVTGNVLVRCSATATATTTAAAGGPRLEAAVRY